MFIAIDTSIVVFRNSEAQFLIYTSLFHILFYLMQLLLLTLIYCFKLLLIDLELTSSALVVTVEETSIMCCSSGSFVSQGLFRNFCLRFANDFDSKAEEWVFSKGDIFNTCKLITCCNR